MEVSEFTDKIGKGDLNIGYVIMRAINDIRELAKTNIQNNEDNYICYQNAIMFLRDTLDFKLRNDPEFNKQLLLIAGDDGIVNELPEWRKLYRLLVCKCDEYGYLPAEETELYE